jgi:hypothetical protein
MPVECRECGTNRSPTTGHFRAKPMKRSRLSRNNKQTPDTTELIRLATGLSQSACRLEDAYWEQRLTRLIDRLLNTHDEAVIITALDQLYADAGSRAYDELIDIVESSAETRHSDTTSGFDAVLVAIPILAWSRFQIPSGSIPKPALETLRTQLQAHVLATDARLGLADLLFSPDQLPQNYVETAQMAAKLAKAALHGQDLKVDVSQLAETINFLSDTRYILAAVAAPRGAALFRWQEDDSNRDAAFQQWRSQGGEALRPLLPACASELLPPSAYHAAVRDADRASRPYSIQAAMSFLQTVLNRSASEFTAVVGSYYDSQLEEYRIGFTLRDNPNVVHGLVWPLLDSEDESAEALNQIETVLRQTGLEEIRILDHRLPLEYCDDCGAPLYPNHEGEPTHAELPEDPVNTLPRHLH